MVDLYKKYSNAIELLGRTRVYIKNTYNNMTLKYDDPKHPLYEDPGLFVSLRKAAELLRDINKEITKSERILNENNNR